MLAADDAQFRRRFAALLLEVPTRDVTVGFELARDLGTVVAPVLWAMRDAEKSNMRRRMTVQGAALLAEGVLGDERTLSQLDDDRIPLQDRLVTCLLLALGPGRTREVADFWPRVFGRNQKEPEPLLQVAALLTSARFPGAGADFPQPLLREGNAGVVAAALFAGTPVPDSVLQPFLRRDPPAHANLVWRGLLLGSLLQPGSRPAVDSDVVARARELLNASGPQHRTTREAAALVLGRAGAVSADQFGGVDRRLLQWFAADADSARQLARWLEPAPQLLDADLSRLAVEYVLGRGVEAVLEDRAAWSGDLAIRRHVAIALAWRLCAAPATVPIDWSLDGVPEWFFVRWASGATIPKDRTIDDPELDRAAVLAADGRLPRAAARRLLEEALWRWGSHPGLGLWEAQRWLLRDLLLSGSLPGHRYEVGLPDHLRFLPAGLGDENDFFVVAVDLYEFLRAPTLPIPEECRLR
ncbi:MAG: hypothetical protein AB7O97_00365 [Planctomycetota bacterium]